MITTNGRNHIRRYLAEYVTTIGGAVAFGIGARAESPADVTLQFETARAVTAQVYYDFANNKVVYKTAIPEDYVGNVFECGLYSVFEDTLAGNFGSRTIVTFDSVKENWIDTTTAAPEAFTANLARIGGDALVHTPAASATKSSSVGVTGDYSGYSGNDILTVALQVNNGNTSAASVQFLVDNSNYYSFSMTTAVQSSGYKVIDFTKGSAAVTGSPRWDSISGIRVITTSTAGGNSDIGWDGIRWNDVDTNSLDHILVARKVLTTPMTKISGQSLDVEFSLDISV